MNDVKIGLNPELAWDVYKTLEEELIQYIRYVPLTEMHYPVWSFYLGNLLNNIGSIIDSFFKNAIHSPSLNLFEGIDIHRARDQQDMGKYREIFERFYQLSNKKIYELQNFSSIMPYSKWKDDKTPEWWDSYRKIKHDRFQNKEKATLKTTLDALGGLFLLNVIHLETRLTLVDTDVTNGGGYAKEYLRTLMSEREPIGGENGWPIYVKTQLFGYVYESNWWGNLCEDDHKQILSPSYPGYFIPHQGQK